MKFGFLSEGETRAGQTHYHRYYDLIDEVLLAEKVGFDVFATSEQHFAIGGAAVSAPEVLYPYLMARTERIRFLHAVTLLPMRFNHPLRVAERVATEDILSNGRVELGTGRGNTALAIRAFEVPAEENKAQWDEGIDLIRAAFLDDPFEYVGKYYKVPPRSLNPKPVQQPHPPLSVAATSPQTHVQAGEKGIGVMSLASYMGFDYLANCLKLYEEAFASTDHPYPVNHETTAFIGGCMHCAETTEQAREEFLPALEYAKLSVGGYERLAQMSSDYAYMGAVKNVDFDNIDLMLNESAGFIVGDPEECIRQVQRYLDLGYENILMRIDSMPHDQIMKSLDLFGRYVIPHFKAPSTVVKPAQEVLDEIRDLRPLHEDKLRQFEAAQREAESSLAESPAPAGATKG